MKRLLAFRMFVFAFQNFIPIMTCQWSSIILPDILRYNLKIVDESTFSLIANYFYISYFIGIILGCFIWPYLVQFISKRNCILISTFMIGVANIASGYGQDVTHICACRFVAGCFLNIHTVGKDFLFDFVPEEHRQFTLSLDSCFGLMGHLGGPFIGMHIYYLNDRDFKATCFWIGVIFFFGVLLFLIAFYIIEYTGYHHGEGLKKDTNRIEEERVRLRNSEGEEQGMIEVTSTLDVFKVCANNLDIRNSIIVFGITTAASNCDLVLSVIYLQTPWADQGLSISPVVLSNISLLSFLPALSILLYSPKICPSRIPYLSYIRIFVFVFALAVLVTPLFRDILPEANHADFNILVYLNQIMKYCTNCHIVAPFIHYTINRRANRHIRTTINSINFVISTTLVVVFMNLIVPLLSVSLYSPQFQNLKPFNKYFTFVMVAGIQLSCFYLIGKQNKGESLDRSNQN
jgi:MFS family permease